ncbi:TerC/Alx family metal homeostasis membrane protein [Candidatus Protochlamydia phocaeensis]|uniref:TerC/Alx family metal homeostasis membrane protein n=1 Tax=Candidatus Protochlamydia phocaeensis TaxID=1414722 RepID=UPI0009AC7537|nr:TerC/Alx family metal homeostasis membrane protein [Candidatus Protochlamydia phocaeensis]
MIVETWHWIGFNFVIFLILGFDLWHAYVKPHAISFKEALLTSAAWIALALLFNVWLYFAFGPDPALTFLTGYLLEKSLSVDNLFIFLLLFSHFNVPDRSKHKVLFYGVLGAIIMRGLLIWGGIALVQHFDWIFYVFGAFLIITGIRLAFKEEKEVEFEKNFAYRVLQSWIPLTSQFHGQRFFVKQNQKWLATPLLLVLVLIELADLVFAIDSIPAILGITTEPFIVYTSNILAILGLRALFFVLESLMNRFYLLHYALALILGFIGCKMLLHDVVEIPTLLTLGIVILLLSLAALGSFLFPLSAEPSQKDQLHQSKK